MHLSSIDKPWGKPFTSKRYIHPPFAENVITMWPSSMVLISELGEDELIWVKDKKYGDGYAYPLMSAGVIFTLKRGSDLRFRTREASIYKRFVFDHDFMPIPVTEYKTRKDGVPVHVLKKDLDAVKFYEEAFCDDERTSTVYIKVTIENTFDVEQAVELGVLTRTGPEFLFTGCIEPDGYLGYEQTRDRWNSDLMKRYDLVGDYLTDGDYKLYFDDKLPFTFDKEKGLVLPLTLKPYEKRRFTFAFTRNKNKPKTYFTARKLAIDFWKGELNKAKKIPSKKGIEPLFYNFLAQLLQMFASPREKDYVIMRQGAMQHYHWPEAKEMFKALSRIGGYSKYLDLALEHYFINLQEKDGDNQGRIHYAFVPWNSRTAAALEMFSYAVESDDSFYDKYVENAMDGFRWMERERAKSSQIDGAIKGLFPPGIATDNHFKGAQQWTQADAAMIMGYKCLISTLRTHNSPYSEEVDAAYREYSSVMQSLFDKFAREQEDSEFLYLPRDAKNDPEIEKTLDKDPFHYAFSSKALEMGLAGYGTRQAEKVIYTYTCGNQSKNGLLYPCYRSTTGAGRTWYTTAAEANMFFYYMNSGEREKAEKIIDTLLKYNVTTEYYQPERYDDHNAYIAPWMPNASANGRVLDMLFEYYGSKDIEKE